MRPRIRFRSNKLCLLVAGIKTALIVFGLPAMALACDGPPPGAGPTAVTTVAVAPLATLSPGSTPAGDRTGVEPQPTSTAAAASGPSATPVTRPSALTDVESLVRLLAGEGIVAEVAGELEVFLFSVTGIVLSTDGGRVTVFEYDDVANADIEASRISADGSTMVIPSDGQASETSISWFAAPHFYMAGGLIALYVGDDDAVLTALGRVMGPQFAGE